MQPEIRLAIHFTLTNSNPFPVSLDATPNDERSLKIYKLTHHDSQLNMFP